MTSVITTRRSRERPQSGRGRVSSSDLRPPLRRAVIAEAVRTFSTPGWLILLGVAILLPVLGTVPAALSAGHRGGINPATADGVRKILASGFTAGLLATLLGVLSVTAEYRHGTVGASVLASGSRTRWASSKVLVTCPLGLVFTFLGQTAVLVSGLPILAGKGVHPDVWSGDLLRMTLGTATLGFIAAAWGVGLGLCIRNQLAAVAGVVLYSTVAEAAFLAAVPAVGQYLPGGAQAAIVVDPTLPHLSMAAGYLLFMAWTAVSLLVGRTILLRRDLPV
jgi:ABC-2 type transport system permease protein